MKKQTFMTAAFAAILAATLPSCNKDDVIDGPDEPENGIFRPATSQSSPYCDRVFEWTPAPGQFINDFTPEALSEPVTDPSEAARLALGRLDAGQFVSLGAFGGYIVVGFDHSIMSSAGDYDFAVAANAFLNAGTGAGGSNEPGIVYVMQDSNGNGLPDDVWYELKGSDTSDGATVRDYAVTYVRPDAPGCNVSWTDNRGAEGTVDYLAPFHKQDYYYPCWVKAGSYTLSGTCLKARTSLDDATGYWNNAPFGWGYADNMGADNFTTDRFGQCNRFRISDAIDADGNPALLTFADFVRIQTGVNAKSGILGEVSTEVFGVFDLHL